MIHGQRVVDSHQHFWQLGPGKYTWLVPEYGELYASFDVDDVEPQLQQTDIDDVVLVQADDTLADTESMLAIADRWPRVAGVVGWVPLDDETARNDALARLTEDARIVGIRHLIHEEANPDWVVRSEVVAGLVQLAEHQLVFDVVSVLPQHLEHVGALADRVPELQLVIDHLAKPPIDDPEALQVWKRQIQAAARSERVVAKLSGLNTVIGPGFRASDLREVFDTALDAFGPARLMFGSDWPVSILADGYLPWWNAVKELIAELSADEQIAILGGTARRVYGLPESA